MGNLSMTPSALFRRSIARFVEKMYTSPPLAFLSFLTHSLCSLQGTISSTSEARSFPFPPRGDFYILPHSTLSNQALFLSTSFDRFIRLLNIHCLITRVVTQLEACSLVVRR